MANTKEYRIRINGIDESVKAIDSLNDALQMLEQKIKNLEARSVKIDTSGGGSTSTRDTGALQTEDKLLKEIASTEQKIADARRGEYQSLLANKDVLSQTVNAQKQVAAQERLTANAYENTMQGMKQQLADLKSVLNTTDLGSGEFDKMTKKINELNGKLKELEQSYGQFGRNVGNYSSVFDGMEKLTINIGGVTREFNSAREASRTLRNELIGLTAAGKQNSDEANELRKAYYNLQSAMDDATKSSKAMDEAMDYMQSFSALASAGNGLKAFFGFDDTEIQRSIQRLVSLQNVLQGIEILRKQMATGEGFGKLLTKGSDSINSFVAAITGAQKGVNGLTMGSRTATIAVRGLSMALKGLGIGIAIAAISALLSNMDSVTKKITNFFSGTGGELANAEHVATAEIDAMNEKLKYQQGILSSKYMNGFITDTDYARKNVLLLNEAIQDNISALSEQALEFDSLEGQMRAFTNTMSGMLDNGMGITVQSDMFDLKTEIKNIDDAKSAWKEYYTAVQKGQDVITANGAHSIGDFLMSFIVTAKDARQDFEQIGQAIAADWVNAIGKVNIKTDEGQAKLRELIKVLNTDEVTHSVMLNLDKYIPDERVRLKIENVIKYAKQLEAGLNFMTSDPNLISSEGYAYWEQVRIDGLEKGSEKIRAQIALNARKEKDELIKQYGDLPKARIEQIDKKYARMLQDQLDAEGKTRSNDAKKRAKEQEEAEKELRQLKIAQMKNGFEKEKAQLNEERRERIARLDQMNVTAKKKQEILVEINALYDKKILDAKRDWAYNMVKVYEDMYQKIEQLNRQSFQTERETASSNVESRRYNDREGVRPVPQMVMLPSENISQYQDYYGKILDIEEKASERQARIEQERLDRELEYNKEDEELRHKREVSIETSNAVIAKLQEYENAHGGLPMSEGASEAEWKKLEDQMKESLEKMMGTLVDAYNNGEISFKDFCQLVEREQEAHNSKMNALEKEYAAQSKANEDQLNQEKLAQRNEYYQSMINIVRRNEDKISQITENTPKVDKYGWGIVNIKATQQSYNDAINGYKDLAKNITAMKGQLKRDLDSKKISHEDFLMRDQEFDEALKRANDSIKNTMKQQKELVGEFIQSINRYFQELGQAFSSLLSSIADYEDSIYEKRIEELDKWIDKYEEKMDEQEEIAEQHKSAIDSIEDELSSARGDRRQQLIDQLNAEMALQRQAVAEEKKAEREKKKLEEQKEKEEKKQKQREHKRQVTQAIISAALATANGLATQPFMPVGIAMGALAAALGAAQVALIKSQKYASGGVIEGKSHAQGGVKVLGGRAEVEGGEMITNKVTTTKNVDLLYYINSKKRKLNLDDFIEFYSDGRTKNTIKNLSPRQRFADGGTIPTLRNDIDVNERMYQLFEDYSERPVVVSVVDINNRQDAVRNVKVIAGLDA